MNKDLTPHRLRESSFRRFELDIAHIVTSYPSVIELSYKDKGYSILTFEARLRDAMKSLFDNGWATVTIDMVKFVQNYVDIVVSHQGEKLFAGGRREISIKRSGRDLIHDIIGISVPEQSPSAEVTFNIYSPADILLIAKLASARVLLPIKLKMELSVTDCHTEVEVIINQLEQNYDVGFTKNPDGTWTVL